MKDHIFLKDKLVRSAGIFAVLSLLTIGFAGVSSAAGGAIKPPGASFEVPSTTRSFADVVEQVSPSVVTISVTKQMASLPTSAFPRQDPGMQGTPFDDFFGRFFDMPGMTPDLSRPTQALGSGFLIDESGYVVTNNHVIENADSVNVMLQDGREFDATLVGTDPKTDIALLKIESTESLPALHFGDSDKARVGDWVLAIGNPFGLGGSATAGIISARGRDIRSGPYDDFLQIDAPINSGNSGGPVFNADGEVIGVNTAIVSPNGGNVGIGFAIPAKQAQAIVADLRTSGVVHRGWLGVQIQDIDKDLATSLGLHDTNGALVADVVNDSPASKAGLQVGDVITNFDGNDVTSAKSLSVAVANTNPSDKVPVKFLRDGKQNTLQVKLGEVEQTVANAIDNPGRVQAAGGELGLGLSELTDGYRQQLGLPEGYAGVLVSQVAPDSPAAKQGIRPGDVISRVGSTSIHNVSEAKAAIAKAKSVGKYAALLLRRRDGQQFVTVAFS